LDEVVWMKLFVVVLDYVVVIVVNVVVIVDDDGDIAVDDDGDIAVVVRDANDDGCCYANV